MSAILMDGAAGTLLWAYAEEQGIPRCPTWIYNLEQPQLVQRMYRHYLDAGSKLLQTNTFSVNSAAVSRSSSYTVREVITAGVMLAREAVEGTDADFYLSIGPLTDLMAPYGKLTEEAIRAEYREIFTSAKAAGAELAALETFMDLRMMVLAAEEAKTAGLRFFCSMTFEKRRRTMMGDSVEKIVAALTPLSPAAIGMNCSHGPATAREIIEEFHQKTDIPLYYKPNSGMGESYTPAQFAMEVAPVLPYVSYVGGCCGCDGETIRALGKLLEG